MCKLSLLWDACCKLTKCLQVAHIAKVGKETNCADSQSTGGSL